VDLESKLLTAFAPIVTECLTDAGVRGHGKLGITHLLKAEGVDVWTLDLPIEQKLTASDLIVIAGALNTFCSRMETVTIDGAFWHIGNRGDDPTVVFFYKNAFHIWVRTLA
jgi:hypothetical protein